MKVNNDGDEDDGREINREKEVNHQLCAFATIIKNLIEHRICIYP